MLIGVGCDVVSVVIVLPPLHARAQEQSDEDAHDGILGARGEELIVAHVMADQGQLHDFKRKLCIAVQGDITQLTP